MQSRFDRTKRGKAGEGAVTFDARHLPIGVYFYRLRAGHKNTATKKLLLS